MDDVDELKKKLKEIGEQKAKECGFTVGECVLYTDEKSQRTEQCRITNIYGHEGKLVILLQNTDKLKIGWSSNKHYLNDTDNIKKIPEPIVDVAKLNEEKERLEDERYTLTKKIDAKIRDTEKSIWEEQKKCIHKWDNGTKRDDVEDSKDYTCVICGVIGNNI